jgi:hypothetical protein
MGGVRAVAWTMAPLALLLAGCFDSTPPDGAYACAAPPTECPPGLLCASDRRCRRHELPDSVDMASSIIGDGGGDGGGPDLLPSTCGDGKLDGDETDVDCGGSCLPCDVPRTCKVSGDCSTNSCNGGRCELATAPPFWRPLPLMANERVSPTVLATPDRALLAIGGGDSMNPISNTVERYDINSGTWGPFAATVLARSAGAGGIVGGKPYVAGGLGNESQLEVYDSVSNMWSVVSNNIGFQIDQAGFVVSGDALYVFGGLSAPGAVTDAVNRFTPATGWTALALMTPRRALGGALGSDGLIYAVGGNDGTRAVTTAQRYSTVSGQWSDGVALPAAADNLGLAAAADGRLYAVGGNVAGAPVATVNAYRPGDDRWTALAPLQNPRAGLGVVTGADGLVYAIGGGRTGATALRDVEAYGPTVQLAPSPLHAGTAPTASGSNFAAGAKVLVYGGPVSSGTPIASGNSDGTGVLAPISLPAFTGAGSFLITFVDSRSRYPIVVAVTVLP